MKNLKHLETFEKFNFDEPLKDVLKRELNLTDDDFDRHETDLYVRATPEVRKWLKDNYEYYSNIRSFHSQTDGDTWLDIPFAAWEEKYGKRNR